MNSSAALECADRNPSDPTIRTENLSIKSRKRLVTVDGNPVCLTSKEYGILELLSFAQGHDLNAGDVPEPPLPGNGRAGGQDHRYLHV